ncbi:MAG: glycosyltransferase family 4 protein [Bryobacteraceae bacterium]
MHVGILASHPIQYQAPWFRSLGRELDLEVFFAHRPDAEEQSVGFGGAFEWDVDLLSGYQHSFLANRAQRPNSSHFFGCDTLELSNLIKRERFNAFIVSGWNLKTYWQAVRACRRERIPVLVRGDSQLTSSTAHLKRIAKQLTYPFMLRQFDGFLSVGSRNRAYLRHYGVADQKIFFVPHFVDNEWFALSAEEALPGRAEQRMRWGAGPRTLIALFVGKFVQKKRPHDLLRAVGLVRDSNIDVMAVLVGSGELENDLRAAASDLGVRVAFEGFRNQTELPHYYAASDVLVLPSDGGETWGLVVNEAMACGRPAIVSDAVGCARDLIEESRTGFTFPCGDTAALAGRLCEVSDLSRNEFDFRPFLREKMQRYSAPTATEATVRAIHSVAGSAS